MTASFRILVLGASGRLGGMLRRHWSDPDLHPVWQFRIPPSGPVRVGDVLVLGTLDAAPACPPVDLVLGLAGVVPGKGAMSENISLGLAAVRQAVALGARHVVLASSAAVYGASKAPLTETTSPLPVSDYGRAKLEMEEQSLALSARHGVGLTLLRIGNVAGADALLAQSGTRRTLDRFESGQGPARSYIGPHAFTTLLQSLIRRACSGTPLPAQLNFALKRDVAMADLCEVAGLRVVWRPAPATAFERVVLDVSRLASLVAVPDGDARAIVADWQADQAMRRDRQ